MQKVRIGEFRNRVSHFIRRAAQGETIVILNRDEEVAILKPCPARRRKGRNCLLGWMKGTLKIRGDIVGPIIPAEDWFRT